MFCFLAKMQFCPTDFGFMIIYRQLIVIKIGLPLSHCALQYIQYGQQLLFILIVILVILSCSQRLDICGLLQWNSSPKHC